MTSASKASCMAAGDETGAVTGSASDGEENDAVGKPAILHRVLEL